MKPELRFPDFKDKWKEVKLGDLLEYKQPTKYIVKKYSDNGLIPVLTAGKTFILGYTKNKANIYYNLPVIIFDDFTTDCKYVNFPFAVKSSAIKILKTKNKNAILKFIFEKLQTLKYQSTSHKRHWISEYTHIKIKLPSLPEQQKIANFLNAIDDKIELQTKKIEQLENYKKGIMQKLISGEIRFPKFKDEWRENKLEEIIEEVKSKNNDNAPLFSLIIEKGLIPKTDKYKREFLVKDKKNAYVTIFKNQFAYNPMNVRFGAIARLKNIEKAKVSKYYNIFQCKHNCNPVFLEYFLLHPNRIKLYNKVAIGSLLEKRRIYFNDFLKLKMKLPTLP